MIQSIFTGFSTIFKDVLLALLPLFAVFSLFQFFWIKLPKKQYLNISKGFLFTFFGLVLFLQGVNIGFIPIGEYIGTTIGSTSYSWALIPIGFVLGFVVTFAEPAVRVLNIEVEKASSGHIRNEIMLYFLSIGVAISVALSMFKILKGISLWYFIIPGYILVFILTKFVDSTFVGIAFDSGGVATGPMTVTFISSLAVGFASVLEGRNPLVDGFGMISLVALTPTLSILILGVLYELKEKRRNEETNQES
ncbi:putative membrane protein DUF1538 [Gottschalkia purinilytica]|uniref:Putative membrane protein DUF1538 n=1 Tax=Gottschalkia purinilytica TaxID=1503 RepID=A0A0L0WAV5_GOTPU|nr:DUF1538 domain-containing protein [Gottschalkia purinilytica]KNF08626.1 putative membrane protein DUF1538 [Gottschalkia purinilytica]